MSHVKYFHDILFDWTHINETRKWSQLTGDARETPGAALNDSSSWHACAWAERVWLQWAGLGSVSRRVIGSVVPPRPRQCLRVRSSARVCIHLCGFMSVYVCKRVSKRPRSVQSVSVWGELGRVCGFTRRPVAQRRLRCFPMGQSVCDGESGVPLQLGQDHQYLPATHDRKHTGALDHMTLLLC